MDKDRVEGKVKDIAGTEHNAKSENGLATQKIRPKAQRSR